MVFDVQVSQAVPGVSNYFEGRITARRNAGVLHRTLITAVDKLATPASPTGADVATGGSLAFNTAHNFTVAAGNVYGDTTVPANGTVTTANDAASTHVIRVTVAQVASATFYDLFLSTAANPLWVARITEAQRASGCTVTAVGTVSATTPGAGLVDIRVVGTGLASNVVPFTTNNAYLPTNATPINCAGFSAVLVNWRLSVTDLRSAPTLALAAFWQDQVSSAWHYFSNVSNNIPSLLTAVRSPLQGVMSFNSQGVPALVILVDTISGQGASVDISVELA